MLARVQEQPVGTKYAYLVTWGAGMVLAFVPNDVNPSNSLESVVTTFVMLFGFFMNMVFVRLA